MTKHTVDGIEIDLDEDITLADLDQEPTPENALTEEQLNAIQNQDGGEA